MKIISITIKRQSIFLALLCCCVCFGIGAQELPVSVSAVIEAEGRSNSWQEGTKQIRKDLATLNLADPAVQKFLPAIERRCKTLLKLNAIGSTERAIFLQFFEAMLEDLAKGEKVLARYAGQTINYGYWSDEINSLTGTKVQVPPSYNSEHEYQMFMYYKLGGGMYWFTPSKKWAGPGDEGAKVSPPFQPTAEVCQQTPETFHVWSALYYGVKGRQGIVVELKELTRAMNQDFSISPDRLFLSGYSDGGFTAMWIATHYPHLVAGIAPGVANWQYVNSSYFGFFNVPTLVVDGWGDGGFVQENLSRFLTLNNMGYDISCIISHHGHNTDWFKSKETTQKIMEWAKSKRRDLNRKHIKYSTWNLAFNRAYWFSIERMENPLYAAVVDAKIEGNTVHVTAKNIAAYHLDLNPKLLDPKKPVSVITNGKQSYAGPYGERLSIELVKAPEGVITKSPERHGGVMAHADHSAYFNKKSKHKKFQLKSYPWSWVGMSGEDAKHFNIPSWARPGEKVTEGMIKNQNLMIYGGPLRNKFTERIADGLPITFEPGKFTIGDKVYDQPQHWVRFICPNPLNPERDCLIVACNDPKVAREKAGFKGLSLSPWGFRNGDCQVFGVERTKNTYGLNDGSGYGVEYHIFNAHWQASDQAAIGEATKPFYYRDVLRLKAHAIKEHMQVDVGLYGSQPGYIQWQHAIKKGPISVQDIAVTHALPEFILTCELTGRQLKSMVLPDERGRVSVKINTVFNSKDDPGYEAGSSLLASEIEDEKVYKVAAGYGLCDGGTLGLRWNASKMPKPHFYFESVKEFCDHEGGSASCQNLVQTQTEVTEAVVSYIKKRGKITPFSISGQLTEYIASPENNHYTSHHWSHLSLTNKYLDPKSKSEKVVRVTLGIGSKVDEGTDGEKVFRSMPLNDYKPNGQVALADKRLSQNVTVLSWGIAKEASGQFKLVEESEAALGTVRLLNVSISNKSDREIDIIQAICNSNMTKINGSTWSTKNSKDFVMQANGYLSAAGNHKKPYHRSGIFFLDHTQVGADKLVIPSGYNNGLIGLKRNQKIPASETRHVLVAFVEVQAQDLKNPKIDFSGLMKVVCKTIKDALVETSVK